MDPIVLAYLAGVLDSDGSIGVRRSTYWQRHGGTAPMFSERITVRQVERTALDLFAATFGGSVALRPAHSSGGRPLYDWQITDRKAAAALDVLLPYLRIKHAQAANCLELRRVKTASAAARVAPGRGHAGGAPRPAELTAQMEQLFLRAKELNRVGVTRAG